MKSAFQTILLLFLALVPVAVTGFLAYGTGRWGAEHGGLVLGIGLGLAALASLAGLLLFYALSRPWQRLLEGVQEFARGNLDYRLALRSGGEIGRLVVALNEMAAKRQEAEKALLRINRALRTLSACNEVLVRATEKEHLLGEVCRILVELGGYRLAWVGEALEDGEKTVRPVAWAGCEEGYLSAVRISWGENEWGRGPTGRAIRTGEPVICRDVLIDAHYTPWREEALRRGYRSSIALPLRSDGRVLGALNVYAAEAGAFDPEEEPAGIESLKDGRPGRYGRIFIRIIDPQVDLVRHIVRGQVEGGDLIGKGREVSGPIGVVGHEKDLPLPIGLSSGLAIGQNLVHHGGGLLRRIDR